MRATLVVVLVAGFLVLVWVFGATLNLFAGFGAILLAIAADVIRTGVKRQPERPASETGVLGVDHPKVPTHGEQQAA